MRLKCLVGAAILAFVAVPALADSYYVVQDTTTKKCTVVSEKPTTTTTTIVGDGAVYTSQIEAQNAMKSVTVCQSR